MRESLNPAGNTLKAPVPPPLLFFVILIAGEAIAHFYPLEFLPEGLTPRLASALPLFAVALLLGVAAFRAFHRSHTSARFGQSVSSLVQNGPYRISRNPLYVALLLVLAGFALELNNAWLLIGAPLLFGLLDRVVVRREEQFLTALFGAEYLTYRNRVRRWL